ncbi:MAG: hypothetical protein STSR0008_07760 [Ignavibacterium sp.]
MLFKRPTHKTFHYEYRFYDPIKDESERRKRRIKFSSSGTYQARRKNYLPLAALIILIIILYIVFGK